MEFTVKQLAYDPTRTEVTVRYSMPNGDRKYIKHVVSSMHSFTATGQNAYADLIGLVQNSLQKMAEEDIREYVRQNSQGGSMAMLYNNYPNCGTALVEAATERLFNEPIFDEDDDLDGTAACTNTLRHYHTWAYNQYINANRNDIPDGIPKSIKISFKDGKRTLSIEKDYASEVIITPEDIEKAKIVYWKDARIHILERKAEAKAEDLLKMFISEVDFRNYKEKGFFTVKSGNRIFRIHRDTHKFIDMFEKEGEVFVPRNRLCVHTPTRELPKADEALAKLMLIRNNSIIESSNPQSSSDLKPVRSLEELLV